MVAEYLLALASDGVSLPVEVASVFAQYPLVGLEATDEAIVLYKNRQSLWGDMTAQMRDSVLIRLMSGYERCFAEVRDLRDGRERKTTTPTLRGGQRRIPRSNKGKPALLTLTGTLKEFSVGYFPALLSNPRRFSDLCCLLRHGTPISIGEQRQLDLWRQEARTVDCVLSDDTPPTPYDGWPRDAELALRATLSTDARGRVARDAALRAVRMNPYCTLALQLLALYSSSLDSQPCPVEDQPSTRRMRNINGGEPPRSMSKKPWWRVW